MKTRRPRREKSTQEPRWRRQGRSRGAYHGLAGGSGEVRGARRRRRGSSSRAGPGPPGRGGTPPAASSGSRGCPSPLLRHASAVLPGLCRGIVFFFCCSYRRWMGRGERGRRRRCRIHGFSPPWTTSRRLADRKTAKFQKNITRRGSVPETTIKKGNDYPLGPRCFR
ncbi:hypothetical protein GQ55_1G330500 [Panicum hallii var. hallii]|uniref:Uncharacterized protein n=1 Tax=Panicum hallii var. hallii TaxID=1504633 RepID=A0A2T7FA27_9POAL|nr:hypothetical protein GQ55_1G330500 [Panicum hallii var. hallii]